MGNKVVGDLARAIVEEHLDVCLDAGINHEGINAEVAKGQWEFQIFGKGSKKAADEMWVGVVDGTPVTIDVFTFLGITKASSPGRYVCRATFKLREGSTEFLGVMGFPSAAAAAAYTPALASTNSSTPAGRCHEISQDDSYVLTEDRRDGFER